LQRVDRAKKATVASKKKEQEALLEKEKAVTTEAGLVSQLAAANKSLGITGGEEKNKKALAEAAVAGVKTAESQLLVAKTKARKASEIVSSLKKTVDDTNEPSEKEVAGKILTAAKKTSMETQVFVVRAEQELQESREINASALREQKAAEKKLADVNSQVKQLNEQLENAVSKRKTLSEKHASLAGEYKACEKSLKKWQDELAFSQNTGRASE
jgi:chromosome segregation ATPase